MESVQSFFKSVPPFSLLESAEQAEICKKLQIEFFPKGTLILRRDVDKAEFLYIVRKGSVKITRGIAGENERLVNLIGEKDIFGASSLMENEAYIYNAIANEDTICYLFPKQDFLALLKLHRSLVDYFSSRLTISLINAYKDEQRRVSQKKSSDDVPLLYGLVEGLIKRRPVVCPPSISIREAAEVMTLERVGSIVIIDANGAPVGILTDTDMRTRVVARNMNIDAPVSTVMSSPIVTIGKTNTILEAMLAMSAHRVHHLCITEDGRLCGVVSQRDLMLMHGISPAAAIKSLAYQTSIEGIIESEKQMDNVVALLVSQGIRARQLTQLITLFNDKLTERLIQLAQEKLTAEGVGAPPVPFTWLALGSEGRSEQTIVTDQDNAIIFEETDHNAEIQKYFLKLATQINEDLDRCGFPKCKGNIMASNPDWCASMEAWKLLFGKWVSSASPKALLNSAIFFDFRTLHGEQRFVDALHQHLHRAVSESRTCLFFMLQNLLRTKPPLGFFGAFLLEASGENKNKFNIKERALRPLVDGARLLSLSIGSRETNTYKRLDAAKAHGVLRDALMENVIEAFDYMMTLRLSHHAEKKRAGNEPDNFIDPDDLTSIQRNALKEAFRVVEEFQAELKDKFGGGLEIALE